MSKEVARKRCLQSYMKHQIACIIKYYQRGMVEIYDTALTAKYLSEIIFIKIDIKLNLK
jgi:hypothetical protein